jgi:glycosyltransferase involved in cell wall biosynthesis
MRICWMGFLGHNHSWSIVGQNICRSLIKKGHDVHLFSTNGLEYFPEDLKPNLIGFINEETKQLIGRNPDNDYDCQLSYTAMRNFSNYLSHGIKNRFAIWNYETTVLPHGFAKNYRFTDKMLPSSEFSKKIFVNSGIPSEHQVVVPHGINVDKFETVVPLKLKTKKSFKILANIAQPHIRKNISGLLEAYGRAFEKNDDVCLVLKVVNKKPTHQFDVSFSEIFADFKCKYKNHAEIEVITNFIVDIESLYKACDVVLTMTHAECFWMPGLEGMAANKLIIAPRYGGQLDYMNDDNSFLIDGKEIKADRRMQYWTQSPYAAMFEPDVDCAAELLRNAMNNYNSLIKKFTPYMENIIKTHTWDIVAEQILGLAK